jgi:hypothetical protein
LEHVFVDEESSWIGRVDVVIVGRIIGIGGGGGVGGDFGGQVGLGIVVVGCIIIRGRGIDTTDKCSSGGGKGRMVFEIETSRIEGVYGLDPDD